MRSSFSRSTRYSTSRSSRPSNGLQRDGWQVVRRARSKGTGRGNASRGRSTVRNRRRGAEQRGQKRPTPLQSHHEQNETADDVVRQASKVFHASFPQSAPPCSEMLKSVSAEGRPVTQKSKTYASVASGDASSDVSLRRDRFEQLETPEEIISVLDRNSNSFEIVMNILLDTETAQACSDIETKWIKVKFHANKDIYLCEMFLREISTFVDQLCNKKFIHIKICITATDRCFVVARKKYKELKMVPIKIASASSLGCVMLSIVEKMCPLAHDSEYMNFHTSDSSYSLVNSLNFFADEQISEVSIESSSSLLKVHESEDCISNSSQRTASQNEIYRLRKDSSQFKSKDCISLPSVPVTLTKSLTNEVQASPSNLSFIDPNVGEELHQILSNSKPAGAVTLKLFRNINQTLQKIHETSLKFILSKEELCKNSFPHIKEKGVFVLGFYPPGTKPDLRAFKGKFLDDFDTHVREKSNNAFVRGVYTCTFCEQVINTSNVATKCSQAQLRPLNHLFTEFPKGKLSGPFIDFKVTRRGREGRQPSVFSLDCEMLFTNKGFQVGKVTLVNVTEGRTVLDTHVLPRGTVMNYNKTFSGLTAEDINGGTRFSAVQDMVLEFVKREDILVGHSLGSDLQVLRIVHQRVLDTSILYRAKDGRKLKLADICSQNLNYSIQASKTGHDSNEDVYAAADLFLLWYHEKVLGASPIELPIATCTL